MSERNIILITGIKGFIGRNLTAALQFRKDIEVIGFDIDDDEQVLWDGIERADVIVHLAGVNRPVSEAEFEEVNYEMTERICLKLQRYDRNIKILFASSIQAAQNNPYGISKKLAEDTLKKYADISYSDIVIYRLKNVFGKWCRPNYNSAVATFCYNITRDLPISVSDASRLVQLVYIDDVIERVIKDLTSPSIPGWHYEDITPSFEISLGEMVKLLYSFRESRTNLYVPDTDSPLKRRLYATYISYLPKDNFGYSLPINTDIRGSLVEFLKSPQFGQMFISRTKAGITRGNHYHQTKVEKFLVVEGRAIIRFKHIEGGEVIEYPISGEEFKVVDIPPGYTHSIENIGDTEMVVLFWSDEMFNKENPDTYPLQVL